MDLYRVVSYRNSTSNHNYLKTHQHNVVVVSYRNSTSNHNPVRLTFVLRPLYLIEILHQTTTMNIVIEVLERCILSKFYIKPQQVMSPSNRHRSCILSKFYIKPQQYYDRYYAWSVVSYRNSTSNHNYPDYLHYTGSVVSYRNSTSNHNIGVRRKPKRAVVSYRNSTSNHNVGPHID